MQTLAQPPVIPAQPADELTAQAEAFSADLIREQLARNGVTGTEALTPAVLFALIP